MDSRRSTRASCCPLRRWAPQSSMLTIKTILWLPGLWLPWVCLPCPQWARLWCPADDSAGWPVLHWEDHLHTISPGEGLSWDKVHFNCTLWSSSRSRCIHCTRSTWYANPFLSSGSSWADNHQTQSQILRQKYKAFGSNCLVVLVIRGWLGASRAPPVKAWKH